MPRVVCGQLAKYRFDVRGVAVDIRHHDDDIARTQGRVGAEGGQQLVVENLHFPLGAVADMKHDGVIGSGQGGPVALRFRHGAQLAYVVLQLAEQAVAILAAERLEHIDAQCLLLE